MMKGDKDELLSDEWTSEGGIQISGFRGSDGI